ncbi:MAG: thioesterase [Legionellales bacterium]|nr:thioesterase [Legionellales bacterium]|tara:strand:- start:1485 stop:1862 length:378 start_codon:yes stop_codon:yes gene_type:complete
MNEIEVVVRGFHLDIFGHVNNARYLEFLEDARWHAFAEQIKGIQARRLAFVIANININYRKPIHLGDTICIDATLHEKRNSCFVVAQKVYDKGTKEEKADALVTCVIVDPKTGRPVPMRELEDIF